MPSGSVKNHHAKNKKCDEDPTVSWKHRMSNFAIVTAGAICIVITGCGIYAGLFQNQFKSKEIFQKSDHITPRVDDILGLDFEFQNLDEFSNGKTTAGNNNEDEDDIFGSFGNITLDAVFRGASSSAKKIKKSVISRIKSNAHEQGKSIKSGENRWHLFTPTPVHKMKSILCDLKRLIPFRYSRYSSGFSQNPYAKFLPKSPWIPVKGKFNSCAVVSSAGTILGSNLGAEIDAHGQVCRMNNAPIGEHADDVGYRTTLRIINDQLLETLDDPEDTFWKHAINERDSQRALVLGWDFCGEGRRMRLFKCHENLGSRSIKKANGYGYQGFANYLRWRKNNKKRRLYVLRLEWIRLITDFLRRHSPIGMTNKSVPSTGFIGLVFLMHHCPKVDIYHMIPPKADPGQCKYFQNGPSKSSLDCSLFPGHEREVEISFMMAMNMASDKSTYINGKGVIPGLQKLKC